MMLLGKRGSSDDLEMDNVALTGADEPKEYCDWRYVYDETI